MKFKPTIQNYKLEFEIIKNIHGFSNRNELLIQIRQLHNKLEAKQIIKCQISLLIYCLLGPDHKKFHSDANGKINKEGYCVDCMERLVENLQSDLDSVSKQNRGGHFIFQFNQTVQGNGRILAYYFFGDYIRELLPSNTILIKMLGHYKSKENFKNTILSRYNINKDYKNYRIDFEDKTN